MSRRAAIAAAGGGAAAGVALMLAHTSGGPTHGRTGRAIATSFGSVSLVGSSRILLSPAGVAPHEHGHAASGTVAPSAVHGAWTDAVEVDVEVHNALHARMELSPGQFRVRVDDLGPTVSLYSADRDAGAVEPRSTTAMRIRYLVPPPGHSLSLEFADAGVAGPVLLGELDRRGQRP